MPHHGRLALARCVDAAVAPVQRLVSGVGEGQAFAEDADPLDDHRVVSDPRACGPAAREAATECRAVKDAAERNHAARDGPELLGAFAVEQPLRPVATAVAPDQEHDR